jgi:hypothetical protein
MLISLIEQTGGTVGDGWFELLKQTPGLAGVVLVVWFFLRHMDVYTRSIQDAIRRNTEIQGRILSMLDHIDEEQKGTGA